MADKEVSGEVSIGNPDDELLPLTKCVCGQVFPLWHFVLGIYPQSASECPNCKRRLYFSIQVKVWEVSDEGRAEATPH